MWMLMNGEAVVAESEVEPVYVERETAWQIPGQLIVDVGRVFSYREAQPVADKIEQLWKAADAYTSGYISGVAIGILTIGVLQQKPKALAVSQWSGQVWTEYYVRKASLSAGSALDLDFSSFGPMPYSVPELQAEIGL